MILILGLIETIGLHKGCLSLDLFFRWTINSGTAAINDEEE